MPSLTDLFNLLRDENDNTLRVKQIGAPSLPSGAATEATLTSIAGKLESLKGYTDQLEGFVDGVEALIVTLNGYVDGLEGLLADVATETTLTAIKDTAGIKKITDALPIGDNRIGRFKLTDDTSVATIENATLKPLHVMPSDGYRKAFVESDAYQDITGQDCLVTLAVVHGEDLDVGANNSEPIKVRTEDGGLPAGEKHLVVVPLMHGFNGTNWERLLSLNNILKVLPQRPVTIKSKSGTVSTSGNNTILSAVADKKIKVFSMKIESITATALTAIWQDGAGGTELDRSRLQGPADVTVGDTRSVNPPAFLFETSVNTLLNLNLSGAIAVHYSISYFEEA